MIKITLNTFVLFLAFFFLTTNAQAQSDIAADTTKMSNDKPLTKDHLELQKRVTEKIVQTNWVAKIKSMDAKKLENLKKWHQFPTTETDSNEKLVAAIHAWYNEKPADRAKIILSIE